MLWVAIAAVTILALGLLLRPLVGRGPAPSADRDAAADRAVYRDQLLELERDRARGLLPEEQAASARLEIERRLLATERGASAARDQAPAARHRFAVLLAAIAAAGAGLIYLELGSPDLPDQPHRSGPVDAVPAPAPPAADPALAAEAAALARTLDANPSDAGGWAKLGALDLQLGRYEAARTAFEQAIQQGAEDRLTQSAYGEVLTQLDAGRVGPDAATAFRRALAADPADSRARYYLGLLAAETGELDQALAAWRALLAETAADAPWRALLLRSIAAAEQAKSGAGAAPEPDADALAAAQTMTPEARESFIRGMVEGLAQKLAAKPDDLDGWRRLAHAYDVLGERGKAREAWAKAVALAPDQLELLLDYATAIVAATPGEAPLGPEFDAAVAKIRAEAPDSLAGLYFAGLGAARGGRPTEARGYFEALLKALPADAPQRRRIEQEIEALGGP